MKKKKYISPEIETILLTASFIRTSYEDDGYDDDWNDENAMPNGF